MWRSLFTVIVFLHSCLLWSFAEEPQSILVVVTDPEMVIEVASQSPGVRTGILQDQADDSDEIVNAKAVALKYATHLIFDPLNESPRMAMFRERLQMQGVVAIPKPSTLFLRSKHPRPANTKQLEPIASRTY